MTMVAYGTMINPVLEAAVRLKQLGIHAEVLKLAQIKPLDPEPVAASVRKTGRLFVAEETMDCGCVANDLFAVVGKKNLGDRFVTHGSIRKLYEICGLDCDGLLKEIREVFQL